MTAEDLAQTMEWEATREQDRIVVLSDLWLDKPETLDRLEVVMEGVERPPAVRVNALGVMMSWMGPDPM